jgi:DNA-binding beta-propeller fold protein YncE
LALATAGPVDAKTFTRTPLAPELGLDVLTRGVTRERVGRDLFSDPYATVTLANVDVYDRFPWVESRRFQVVSDPRWNRLVFGEPGRSLRAFDGKGSALGALSDPRGMSVDDKNRIYVADAGNNRVVVLEASTESGEVELVPRFAIGGLSEPYDVAFSDGGTPFRPDDDLLYVADTGKNRVVAVRLDPAGARIVATLGDLGSGPGRFAGPMAIAVGRSNGANTPDVYVADAHNRRIVHLKFQGGGLNWVSEASQEADIVTSLDTDAWGNLYAAAPRRGTVQKFSAAMTPVAEFDAGASHPKSFRVPVFTVRDHRDGSVTRVGQASAVSLGQWSDQSGIGLWNLGVEISHLSVPAGETPTASFTLTDRAAVTVEVRDAASGRVVAQRALGPLEAGSHSIPLAADVAGVPPSSDLVVRVAAVSSYPDGATDMAEASFRADGAAVLPARPMLLGNSPNPSRRATRITFLLPDTRGAKVALRVYDANGRRVRSFDQGFAPGLNEVVWDGADEQGHAVSAGVYFYRLDVDQQRFTRSMVVVR